MHGLLDAFADAFGDPANCRGHRPGADDLRRLLAGDRFIALADLHDGAVVGGLAAYELPRFEQAPSEIYLYDLAVCATRRRRRIANALIGRQRALAAARGAGVVQTDTGAEDVPATALYERLGRRSEVLPFDIAVGSG